MSLVPHRQSDPKYLKHLRQRSESNLLSPLSSRRMLNAKAGAISAAMLATSQYSDPVVKGSVARQYYQVNGLPDTDLYSPRRLEYRGWDRESDHSVSFGLRGKESWPMQAQSYFGSSRIDEPLVPRPTFVRPTSADSGGGFGSGAGSYAFTPSALLVSPPSVLNASNASHFSITTKDLYSSSSREVQMLPHGSPYHRLREYRAETGGRASTEGHRRRPVSAHLNDSSDTFLDWSADTIVSHFGMRFVEITRSIELWPC